MILEVIGNSRSLILRATHIVRLALIAANPGGWERVSEAISRREVQLRVQLEEVFKGADAKPGQQLDLKVEQFRNDTPLSKGLPGAWSGLTLAKGQVFVVLGSAGEVKQALEAALQVLPKETSAELELVSNAEGGKLALPGVAAQAQARAKELDFLFADWIWARFGDEALSGADSADAMFGLLELPQLGDTARNALAGAAVSRAASAPLTFGFGVRRLTQALFRLLAVPQAGGMNDNSVSTWLPAMLHLKSGPPVPARTLFDSRERAELRKLLAAYKGRSDPAPLAAWLE
jgi:hypothetical protein